MTACVRIYTVMGKCNCLTVDSLSLNTQEYGDTVIHSVVFQDSNEDRVTEIERIVEAGQPCNMHIQYEDTQIEAVCTLDGCKLVDAEIHCDKHSMDIIRYKEQNYE